MKAWCPVCQLVDYVDSQWRCTWCRTLTLGRRASRATAPRSVSVPLLREAHELHAHGATLLEAAEAIFTRTKYGRVRDLRLALPKAWASLGLPYRSIPDAQVLRFTKAPPSWGRLDVTPADAVEARERLGSGRLAAAELGVSPRTIYNRLHQA